MVAVRETVPRRSAIYQGSVNNNSSLVRERSVCNAALSVSMALDAVCALLALSVPKAVLPINGHGVKLGKQSALCLSQMQVDGFGWATGAQKLPDIIHMSARLVLRWKLLQRD
jgi:hypothetical protein